MREVPPPRPGWRAIARNWPLRLLEKWGLARGEIDYHLRAGPVIRVRGSRRGLDSLILRDMFGNEPYTRGDLAIRPADVVLDIGAHIGCFACYAAGRAPDVRVIACEPFPDNARLLEHNVRRNGLADRVRIVRAAVADRDGEAELHLSDRDTGSNSLIRKERVHASGRSVRVRTVTLEGLLAEHGIGRVDLLKLDCEGAEGAILESAAPDLLARVERIAVECHFKHTGRSIEETESLLRSHGYRTDRASGEHVVLARRDRLQSNR